MESHLHVRLILGLLVLTSSAFGAEPAPAGKELPGESQTRKALKSELKELRFDGAGLADVIDFFRDVTRENIYVDWPAFDDAKVDRNAPVTINLKGTTVADGLAGVLQQAGAKGFTAEPVGAVIVVSTPQRTKAIAARFRRLMDKPKTRAQRSPLDRRIPEVNFNANAFEDVVNFLNDISGTHITADWKALEKVGVTKATPINLRARGILFGQVLQLVLEAAGAKATLDFAIDDNKNIAIILEPGPV